MKTIDDLVPGKTFKVHSQGMCIRPIAKSVYVHWVGPKAVHYFVDNEVGIRETSVERFLDILNQGKTYPEEDE